MDEQLERLRVSSYIMDTAVLFSKSDLLGKDGGRYFFVLYRNDAASFEIAVLEDCVQHLDGGYLVYFTDEVYGIRKRPVSGMESVQIASREVLCDLFRVIRDVKLPDTVYGVSLSSLGTYRFHDGFREVTFLSSGIRGRVYARFSVPVQDIVFCPKIRASYPCDYVFCGEYQETTELEPWIGVRFTRDSYDLTYRSKQTGWKDKTVRVPMRDLREDLRMSVRASNFHFDPYAYRKSYDKERIAVSAFLDLSGDAS